MKQEIKDYECPYCHKHFLMTRGGLSNHIRWCEDNPKSKINKEHLIEIHKIKHQQYLENLEKQKKEYTFYCKECGKEYKLKLTENEYNKGNYSKYCCKSCANTRHHSGETKEKISNSLKNSEKYQNNVQKDRKKNLNRFYKNENGEYIEKPKKYYCGSKELNDLNPDISCRQSPKYFNKLIPFGLNINTLYSEEFIKEHKKVKDLLYNEYVINHLSPKEIYDKYNCKEYFNHFETLLHLFKDWKFPIRSYSKAVSNAFINGRLTLGNIYTQYKCGWHTTWNNKEIYFRSSFELDYAKELDEQQVNYDVECLHIKYWDSQKQEFRCAIPDFYLPDTNTIVEIKSSYTLDKQNMKDKMKTYKDLGYNFKLICDHKEMDLGV